jgi:hypothetical protein
MPGQNQPVAQIILHKPLISLGLTGLDGVFKAPQPPGEISTEYSLPTY